MSQHFSMTRALRRRSAAYAAAVVTGAAAIGIGAARRPGVRPQRTTGAASPSASPAATGASTPATATTAACSSASRTWAAYGGTGYAPRADLAPPEQQIAVAEQVAGRPGRRRLADVRPPAHLAARPPSPRRRPLRHRRRGGIRRPRRRRPPGGTYTVQAGDTLARSPPPTAWPAAGRRLYAMNRGTVATPTYLRRVRTLAV